MLLREDRIIDDQHDQLYRKNAELYRVYLDSISSLVAALEAKDSYTQKHSDRVLLYARKIAGALNLSEKEINVIENACRLHDLGKIGVPDSILLKAGKLTEEEWRLIKRHPDLGADIIKPLEFLADTALLVRQEHEHFDGSGYPRGLKGEEIVLGARIIAIADAYDAMFGGRVYQKAFTKEEAVGELKQNSGTQFDPRLVDIFVRLFQEGKI